MTFEDTYEECSEITLGDTVYVTDPCYKTAPREPLGLPRG